MTDSGNGSKAVLVRVLVLTISLLIAAGGTIYSITFLAIKAEAAECKAMIKAGMEKDHEQDLQIENQKAEVLHLVKEMSEVNDNLKETNKKLERLYGAMVRASKDQ